MDIIAVGDLIEMFSSTNWMLILIYISSPGPHLRVIQENSDTFQG